MVRVHISLTGIVNLFKLRLTYFFTEQKKTSFAVNTCQLHRNTFLINMFFTDMSPLSYETKSTSIKGPILRLICFPT